VSETDIPAKVCLPPNNTFYYTFSTHFVWVSGPDITAKLCLAPNNTLLGVAVSGGENKTNTGNDFRVMVLSKHYGASDRLTAYASTTVNRLAVGALAGLAGEEEEERGGGGGGGKEGGL
jgi:hypothetical protein